MKRIKFPDKIEAAEVEDGINKEGYFPLCIEIARRYNEYKHLVSRIKYLEDLIKEYTGKMISDKQQ